jgi:hypothetical protein
MSARSENYSDLKVYISSHKSKCVKCGDDLGWGAWTVPLSERRVLCLECSELDQLEFLPAGDAALSRRVKKYSTLWAVVLKKNRSRRRVERQGLLVERTALELAESECLADADLRSRRKSRDAERREEYDQQYMRRFAVRIRGLYPACPVARETQIAKHACLRSSRRVGRTAAAKSLSADIIQLAVIAHIRHKETDYDNLLVKLGDRQKARDTVEEKVLATLEIWAAKD